jgi:hypothetical protein
MTNSFVQATSKIHSAILNRIFHSPMSFFHTTPIEYGMPDQNFIKNNTTGHTSGAGTFYLSGSPEYTLDL